MYNEKRYVGRFVYTQQNPVSSYYNPQEASSPCQGPSPRGDDSLCGVPDWMPGLCSHLCGTDRQITQYTYKRTPVSFDQCPPRSICRGKTCNRHRTYHRQEKHPSEGCHALFWQRCTLETWYMSQPHPLNREEGILPYVYDTLIHLNTLPPCMHKTSSNTELTSGRMPPVGHVSC